MVMTKCPKCGSIEIEKGNSLGGRGDDSVRLVFQSNKDKSFWRLKLCDTISFLCLRCGYLETYAEDLEKYKQELSKLSPNDISDKY